MACLHAYKSIPLVFHLKVSIDKLTLRDNSIAAVGALLDTGVVECRLIRQDENQHLRTLFACLSHFGKGLLYRLCSIIRSLEHQRSLIFNATAMALVGLDEFTDEVFHGSRVDRASRVTTEKSETVSLIHGSGERKGVLTLDRCIHPKTEEVAYYQSETSSVLSSPNDQRSRVQPPSLETRLWEEVRFLPWSGKGSQLQ